MAQGVTFIKDGLFCDGSLTPKQTHDIEYFFNTVFPQSKLNTLLAHTYDLVIYESFCKSNDLPMVSNKPEVMDAIVSQFLLFLVDRGNNKYSISRRLNTLSTLLNIAKVYNPITTCDMFKTMRKNVYNRLSGIQRQAKPIDGDLLSEINERFIPESLTDIRDLAMVNCMFDGLLRNSEVRFIRWVDIDEENNSIFLPESKTDAEKRGTYRFISDTSIAMIKEWMVETGLTNDTDYLWQRMHSKGGSLIKWPKNKEGQVVSRTDKDSAVNRLAVHKAVKRVAQRVMGDSTGVSSHSLRVGHAIEMAKHGVPTNIIAQAGGWKNEAMVLRYIRGLDTKHSGAAMTAQRMNR